MTLKTQKVSAEFPTPRYRALNYYLEKEGRSIETELCKHLEQMYREQVPKEVQEYVKALNPDMEEINQPDEGKQVRHQRGRRKQETVVAAPAEQPLTL